jgi:hypothetical protein
VTDISTVTGCRVFCTDKFYIVVFIVRVAICFAYYVVTSKSINLSSFCCSCRHLRHYAVRSIVDALFGE